MIYFRIQIIRADSFNVLLFNDKIDYRLKELFYMTLGKKGGNSETIVNS